MDVEKYASSKVYIFFEWAFKLVIWNLLSLLIVLLISGLPMLGFYSVQEKYSIVSAEVIDGNVSVVQGNETVTVVGPLVNIGEIENISVTEDKISFNVLDVNITIKNEEEYITIDEMWFDANNNLIISGMKMPDNDIGNIFDSKILMDNTLVDINNNVIIALENGVIINYGAKVETKNGLAGALVIVSIVLALFAFIPCFVTMFTMIKIYSEDGSATTFSLFFNRLWDNFNSLYKTELIIIPSVAIMSFALFYYYSLINSVTEVSFIFSLAYNIILVCLLIVLLWIINLPMSIGYFRMKTKTILKFTLIMTFKNFLYTLLYLIVIAGPIVLCLFNNFFIPVWFLLGFSLPLYIIYHLSSKKYRQLVNDFDSYKEDDIYELKGENDENRN